MRQWIIIGYILLKCALGIYATDDNEYIRSVTLFEEGIEIEYHFEPSHFEICSSEKNPYVTIGLPQTTSFKEKGLPVLPLKEDRIVVSDPSRFRIEVIDTSFVTLQHGYQLYPCQAVDDTTPCNQDFVINDSLYNQFTWFPSSVYIAEADQDYRKTVIGSLKVFPVQYKPAEKKIRICQSLKLRIYGAWKDEEALIGKDLVDAVSYYVSKKQNVKRINTANNISFQNQLLILTVDRYLPIVNELVAWKTTLGFKTEVISKQSWTPEEIKSVVRERYESSTSLHYLLLFGDHEDIPSIYYIDRNYFSDNSYSCMGDNNDYTPDIVRGRISVSSVKEAINVVNKVINYEKIPPVNSAFYSSVLLSSAFYDEKIKEGNQYGQDSCEDIKAIETAERIRSLLEDRGKVVNRVYSKEPFHAVPYYYDHRINETKIPFPNDLINDLELWEGTTDNVIDKINTGTFLYFHSGHGTVDSFKPLFQLKDVDRLWNGNQTPIVFGICCNIGRFEYPESLSEKLLRSPNGAVGVIGATKATVNDENMGLSSQFIEQYFEDYSNESFMQIGDFFMNSILSVTNIVSHKLLYRAYHYFGDPTMAYYTSNPLTFSSATVTKSGTTVTVKSGGVDNCRISLTSLDGGKSYFDVKIGSEAVFTNVTGPYTVSIVKHNYKPYVVKSMSLVGSAELTASLPTGSCSVNGLPSGATVTYTSAHPHLVTVTAGSNNSATLCYTPSNSAPTTHVDTITATVTHNGNTYTLTKSINLLGTEVNLLLAHQDVTWSGNKILNGTYRVYAGDTLTIDGALACTNNAKIYIERGGTLKLTGNAKIKTAPMSGVSGWQGIEAEYQSLTSMGYIDRNPDAELELLPGAVTNTLRYTDGAEIDSRQVCLYNVIKGHEEWQGQKKVIMPSGVTVVSGGCLNIGNDAEVLLKKGASIRVRQTADVKGGQLNIGTNAKLKPFKTGENWKGIDAGTGSILQFYKARLEGADCALSCSGQLAQIKLEQTTFSANGTALSLSDNTSYTSSDPMQYVVTSCSFSNNTVHDVCLNRLKGAIRFSGNSHEGKNTSGFYDIRNSNGYTISGGTWNYTGNLSQTGTGLFLTNSSLNISGVTINNFNYGLRVQGSVGYELKVTSCTFKNNRRGLDFTTGKVTLQNNRFELPLSTTTDRVYGAVLSAVPLYTISNNTFVGSGNSELLTGLGISSSGSGSETKAVKNNTFRSCYYGAVVNGMNRYSLYGGLTFTGNDFSGAYDAIRVVPSNNNNADGIAYRQGEEGKPSGNVFATTSDNALNIMSGCASSIYYYDSNNPSAQKPRIRVFSTTTLVATSAGPSSGPLAYSMNDEMINDAQLTANEAVLQKVNARRARFEQLAPIVQQDSTAIALHELEKVIEEDPHDMLGIWAKAELDTRQGIIGESEIYYEMPLAAAPSFEARKARANWLRVSPNPVEEGIVQLHISSDVWEESAPDRLTVTDIYGTIVWSAEVASGTTLIVLPQRLSSGTYTCTLWGSEGVVVQATALVR